MQIPITDMLKSIPGAVGIRLEEELPYKVVNKMGDIEFRHYEPFTLARVYISGDYEDAMETGFKTLADFIFGKNAEKKKTSMTVPVFMDQKGEEWIMSFYLTPEHETLSPMDPSIIVENMPAKDVAVYSYSGNNTLEKMMEAKETLLQELDEASIVAQSEVWWAQYDQPVSLPVTKRNEALVRVTFSQ